jgi:hypothetical protein
MYMYRKYKYICNKIKICIYRLNNPIEPGRLSLCEKGIFHFLQETKNHFLSPKLSTTLLTSIGFEVVVLSTTLLTSIGFLTVYCFIYWLFLRSMYVSHANYNLNPADDLVFTMQR